MSSEVNSKDMCRACMKNDGVLLSMYDDKTISSENLPYKLAELTSIQIDRFDGLPNMLCTKCAYRTNTLYDFKLQVQETEKKLRMMFKKQMHTKKKAVNKKKQDTMQTGESFKLVSSNDHKSIHCANTLENLTMEIMDETFKNQPEVKSNVSQSSLKKEGINKQNDLHLASIISNLCETNKDQIDIHSLKTDISEEITKILGSQNMNYTIVYIPESIIEPVKESSAENYASDADQDKIDTFNPEEISEEQNKEILNNVHISNSVEFVTEKNKRICKNSSMQEKDKEINDKSNSNVEQSKPDESDGSDTDYFIDPKDNILGSLNDAVTRIKELRKGNTIEYQCTLCLQNYDKLTGALLHTIDNHVPSSGPFFCVVCEKDCESYRELRAHAKTHTGNFPYSCFICNKAYCKKRYLKRHMVCHTDFPRYRCPKCGIRFKIKSELESHVTTHMHGAPYACNQCPRVFNHKGNYKRHLISHLDPQGLHLPKYPCKICGKRFLNNRMLETHTRVHTGEKPFCCEICGRSFSQQGNLLNHARIHLNPRCYKCEICGKRFNQRATLKDHQLLHTGEKPHVCNVCGVAFTFSAALRRHMWVHTGGKPFGCETCGARFVGKYDLRRHMQVHTDRPKLKRKRNATSKSSSSVQIRRTSWKMSTDPIDSVQMEFKEEDFTVVDEPETVLIEQVLPENVTQTANQVESEKENVDALFNLIKYG